MATEGAAMLDLTSEWFETPEKSAEMELHQPEEYQITKEIKIVLQRLTPEMLNGYLSPKAAAGQCKVETPAAHKLSPKTGVGKGRLSVVTPHAANNGPARTKVVELTQSNHPSDHWVNRCEFECKICLIKKPRYKTFGHSSFRTHLFTTHNGMSIDDYVTDNGELITVKRFHACKMCGAKVLHNKPEMRRHFWECAQLTVPDYWTLHVAMFDKENIKPSTPRGSTTQPFTPVAAKRPPPAATSSSATKPSEETPQGPQGAGPVVSGIALQKLREMPKTPKKPPALPSPQPYSTHASITWASQCNFRCMLCLTYSCSKKKSLMIHISGHHKMSVGDYMKKHGDPLSKTEQKKIHKCHLCKVKLVHTLEVLTKHVMQKHKLNLAEYYNNFVSEEHEVKMEAVTAALGLEKIKPTTINNNLPLRILRNGIQANERKFIKWINQCSYSCPHCSYSTNQESVLYSHLFNAHKRCLRQFSEDYRRVMEAAIRQVKHTCLICQAEITHNNFSIVQHVTSHKIIALKYFEEFVLPNQPKGAKTIKEGPKRSKVIRF